MVAFAPTSAAGARAIKASAFFPAISPLLGARFGRRPAFVAGEFAVQRRTLGSMRTRRPAAAPAKSRLVDLKFPHPPLLRYPNTGVATADCGLQMSFTRYEWDVFLSYAHVDDVADVDRKGWVRHLYENVRDRLHRRLGGTPPKIFFDETSVAANHQLDRLCSAARKSAVFLAVTSTNYADRPWTKKELDAFIDSNPWNESNETRLFAVECLDPEDRSLLPHPLDNHIGAYLWEDYGSGCRSLRPGTDDYIRAIDKLVNEIAEKLKELRSAPPPPPAPPAVDAGRTVLLAQPTGDLEEAADQVRSHLGQYGIAVLPTGEYPQGGEAFRVAFTADLARAALFVQLLGPRLGRKPPDLPEGYTRFQAEAASASAIEIVQWRDANLKLDTIEDPACRDLLAGEHVIADTLAGFKAAIVQRMSKPPPPPKPTSSFVFINAAADDFDLAKQIQQEFPTSALPRLDGKSEDVIADLAENMVDCDALIVVNGQTTPFWVRGQLRLYNKLRGKRAAPPRLLELVVEPPENKEDCGMQLAELKRVRVHAPINHDTLQPVIAALES